MSYSTEVLADLPVGYWRLDETSGGTFADSSGNSKTATIVGTPTFSQSAATPDIGGTSVTFGSGQYATVPDDSAVSMTGAFTLEAWVNPTSSSSERYIIEKYDSPSYNGYALRLEGMVPRVHTLASSSYATLDSSIALTAGAWSHLVATYDLTTLKLYVNGTLAGSLTTSLAPTDGTSTLKIAARGDTPGAVGIGTLDEIAIYNTALPLTRIQAHLHAAYPNTGVRLYANYDETLTVGSSPPRVIYGAYAEALANSNTIQRQIYGTYSEALANSGDNQRQVYGIYTEVLTKTMPRYRGWGIPVGQ